MATIVEHRNDSVDSGLGAVGIIAIIVLVLLVAFFAFRWTGMNSAGTDGGTDVNVSGSLAPGSY